VTDPAPQTESQELTVMRSAPDVDGLQPDSVTRKVEAPAGMPPISDMLVGSTPARQFALFGSTDQFGSATPGPCATVSELLMAIFIYSRDAVAGQIHGVASAATCVPVIPLAASSVTENVGGTPPLRKRT
jgi:hypothetical protein